jgi:subtilisin family serine protease
MQDEPIFDLPPYIPQEVVVALSETVDWSLSANRIPELYLAGHTGAGVVGCVLDTGITQNHPDLQGVLLDARDFTGEGVQDRVGHGTHCLGVIAAQVNDIGVRGVAPKTKMIAGKVLTNSGGSDQMIANGIRWAVDHPKRPRFISMSLGAPQPGPGIMAAIEYAAKKGVLVICAAGNDGQPNNPQRGNVNWPAKSPLVCAVAAYGEGGIPASFTCRGPEVDICGPGVNILSTYLNGQYIKMSGTSMATPFIAGVTSLLLEKQPEIRDVNSLIKVLRKGAVDAGDPGLEDGFGLIANPWEIFAAPAPPVIPPAPPEPTPDPDRPTVELELFAGLVAHIPARSTDLFTCGIALKPGAVLGSNIDAVKLLEMLEDARRVSAASKPDC